MTTIPTPVYRSKFSFRATELVTGRDYPFAKGQKAGTRNMQREEDNGKIVTVVSDLMYHDEATKDPRLKYKDGAVYDVLWDDGRYAVATECLVHLDLGRGLQEE